MGKLNVVFTARKDGNMRNFQKRKETAQNFGFTDIYIPKQKHTDIITDLENPDTVADGVYTEKKMRPVGVLTADCMAVVMSDMERVVVVHAGWRGLLNGIVDKGLDYFTDRKDLIVFVSPHARACCYEVKEDFVDYAKRSGVSEEYFTYRDGRIYFSMSDLLIDRLKSCGIERVIDVSLCTICDGEFFSYRKGDFEERILTFSWLSED
ncbi:polyphenol oxidase family protein [Persephonella sp.]|uniref:Purine nucleoside phosphorylase n=1 Tax=Persephonella marina (strain DSM 14350 / EX-H1) TaxID=123214 RepID=C0QSG3_PERMH|nr:polyphenol oxidase family protein [Persephonella sp.]ACO04682.1 conserved hypothetical protein [Persephonella marina EX-H1]